MRFVKFAQMGAGLVVASGAFVMLGGVVAAAYATTVMPTDAHQAQQSDQTPQGTTLPPESDDKYSQHPEGTAPDRERTDTSGVKSDDTDAVTTGGVRDSRLERKDAQKQDAPAEKRDKSPAMTGIKTDDAAIIREQSQPKFEARTQPSDGAAPRQPIAVPVVVVASRQLTIQPTITGHWTPQAGDLAAGMPSPPPSSRQPVPPKSDGALGHLRVMLAATVLPQVYLPPILPIEQAANLLAVLTLTAMLVNLFVFTYGLWLRRGGFATAPRSDASAVRVDSSSFATPLFLGYVPAPPRHEERNPKQFGVRTYVPNAYRKEDMS